MLKRLTYILFAFFFLAVVTGGVSMLTQDKTSVLSMSLDGEEEEETLSTSNFFEEDAIFDEVAYKPVVFFKLKSMCPEFYTSMISAVDLSSVAPPPEQA